MPLTKGAEESSARILFIIIPIAMIGAPATVEILSRYPLQFTIIANVKIVMNKNIKVIAFSYVVHPYGIFKNLLDSFLRLCN